MTNLQIEHLVERWEDRRDVKNQMGKFVHYLLLKKRPGKAPFGTFRDASSCFQRADRSARGLT